jgi:branched-chain amino acid aminotransferase
VSAGILVGITRQIVFEVGPPNGIPVEEARLRPDDLLAADEAFITSSVRDALPISTVDGRPIGTGRAGPVSAKLLVAFREYAHQHSR